MLHTSSIPLMYTRDRHRFLLLQDDGEGRAAILIACGPLDSMRGASFTRVSAKVRTRAISHPSTWIVALSTVDEFEEEEEDDDGGGMHACAFSTSFAAMRIDLSPPEWSRMPICCFARSRNDLAARHLLAKHADDFSAAAALDLFLPFSSSSCSHMAISMLGLDE